MAGVCVAAKRNANVRVIATALGGKATKRRWFEIDNTHTFKYCETRDRDPDLFKILFDVADVVEVRCFSKNKAVIAATPFTFEIVVAGKSGDKEQEQGEDEMVGRETFQSGGQIDTKANANKRTYELGVMSIFDHDSWILSLRAAYKAATNGGELTLIQDPKALKRKITRRVTLLPEQYEDEGEKDEDMDEKGGFPQGRCSLHKQEEQARKTQGRSTTRWRR